MHKSAFPRTIQSQLFFQAILYPGLFVISVYQSRIQYTNTKNKQDKKKSPINPSKSNRRRKNNPIQSVWTLIVSDRRISLLPRPRDLSANHGGLGTRNGAHPESETRNSLWIMQRRLVKKGFHQNYKKGVILHLTDYTTKHCTTPKIMRNICFFF